MGKDLEDFRRENDPTYIIQNPTQVYDRPLPADVNRFIITSAQNGTPVSLPFWSVLCGIAERLNAQILVLPFRYRNPTSTFAGSQSNSEWWSSEVRPYLWNVRRPLNSNLDLLADIKIQPTASSPLTGSEGISHASSGIIGHPKVQTRSIPVPQGRMAKLMMTSGACTIENYSDSRAGKLGGFHHSLSAVLVELDGKRFHARRLHFHEPTNSVTDIGIRHYADRQETAPPALALIMGDTHVKFIDPEVERATFGDGGMVQVCRPQYLVFHDLLDAYAVNVHHRKNPLIAVAKRKSGADDARAEVNEAIDFVRTRVSKKHLGIIVASNHNDMLSRWVRDTNWMEDPTNAAFYLETAAAMVAGAHIGPTGTEYPAAFPYWFDKAKVPHARCLREGESFSLGGNALHLHMDKGPNGARGSIQNLRRLGTKVIGGHSHSPGEDELALQVGTSTGRTAEYTGPVGSWLQAHCVLSDCGNGDSTRQLAIIVDGRYRLD